MNVFYVQMNVSMSKSTLLCPNERFYVQMNAFMSKYFFLLPPPVPIRQDSAPERPKSSDLRWFLDQMSKIHGKYREIAKIRPPMDKKSQIYHSFGPKRAKYVGNLAKISHTHTRMCVVFFPENALNTLLRELLRPLPST